MLVPETLIIREASDQLIKWIPKIIIEKDSQMVIKSILGQIHARKKIRNLIEDINIHFIVFGNIEFFHCNKTINKVAL